MPPWTQLLVVRKWCPPCAFERDLAPQKSGPQYSWSLEAGHRLLDQVFAPRLHRFLWALRLAFSAHRARQRNTARTASMRLPGILSWWFMPRDPRTLGLIDIFPVHALSLPGQISTSVKKSSTLTHLGRHQFLQGFIRCGDYSGTFSRTPTK